MRANCGRANMAPVPSFDLRARLADAYARLNELKKAADIYQPARGRSR